MSTYRGWDRNISIMKHLLKRAGEMTPSMRCTAKTRREFEAWKRKFKAKLVGDLLAPWPKRVPHRSRTVARIERKHHYIEKFMIDVEHDLAAPGYLLIPKGLRKGERRPAILCCHGHGPGKVNPAGIARDDGNDYARQMAERGYVTAVIDSRGFGERSLGIQAQDSEVRCDYLYLLYGILGYHLITLNIHDQMQALDYLLSRPEVDPERAGVMGLSFGGTMAQYVAACDERIRAACIICYLCTTIEYGVEDVNNNCGSQFVPKLYRYGDVATVAGLIAPRPCLVQSGFADGCFAIDSCADAHKELRAIYKAAGAGEKLTIDVFDGEHEFHPPTAYEFFDKWIGPAR